MGPDERKGDFYSTQKPGPYTQGEQRWASNPPTVQRETGQACTLHFCRAEGVTGVSTYHYIHFKGCCLLCHRSMTCPKHLVLRNGACLCVSSHSWVSHTLLFTLKQMIPWTLCQHFRFSSVYTSAQLQRPGGLH